ncbi:Os08g0471700 [Oryza sativa Japonica Group]|uniref:Os08g0471700 protein n=1 Tax=Oryza sativa subsp. japonica TaxID=39947 RepID=A0A0P0XH86_ORYSJ|nr:Os08g0471700 [Oryza sativa Japonica Group]
MPRAEPEMEPDGRRRRRSPSPRRLNRDVGKGLKESECDSLSDCSGSEDSRRDSKRRRRHRRKIYGHRRRSYRQ